jgi:hypothetical protein
MPKCSTSFFEYMWSGGHEQSEDGKLDSLGNYWCSKCSSHLELVNLGSKMGFKPLLDGKQKVINSDGSCLPVRWAMTV